MNIECVVNGPIETNTYFVVAGDEALVIDPAWEGEKLARDFAERHEGVRIAGIVCTHGHADHVGGVAGMRRVLGEECPFMLPADDVDMVAENIERQRAWGIETEHPGVPTRLLHEGDTVAVGDIAFTVIATPGHTPGGIVLYAEHPGATEDDERGVGAPIAFVGDTLFPGSHGRTDLAGGSEETILASLAKMARVLPTETTCFIGHGPSTTIARELAVNPFMQG